MFVSTLEARVPGVAYTIETLERLRQELPPDRCQLFLIVGADSLQTFSKWMDYTRIPELAQIIPVERPGISDIAHDLELLEKLTRELGSSTVEALLAHVVPYEGEPLSSTELRQRIAQGEEKLPLPPGVPNYTKERGLYR
jgi:nicotinate-nucleotide adenylyltransferase